MQEDSHIVGNALTHEDALTNQVRQRPQRDSRRSLPTWQQACAKTRLFGR